MDNSDSKTASSSKAEIPVRSFESTPKIVTPEDMALLLAYLESKVDALPEEHRSAAKCLFEKARTMPTESRLDQPSSVVSTMTNSEKIAPSLLSTPLGKQVPTSMVDLGNRQETPPPSRCGTRVDVLR